VPGNSFVHQQYIENILDPVAARQSRQYSEAIPAFEQNQYAILRHRQAAGWGLD
jgi:hypothetical protein